MAWKTEVNGKSGQKAMDELDSDKRIDEVSFKLDRQNNAEGPLQLKEFALDPKILPGAVQMMQEMNADLMNMNFTECRNLLNYSVFIRIEEPGYQEKYKFRTWLKNLLIKYKIIV